MKLKSNILFLIIKEPYFSEIKNNLKKVEYRKYNDFWTKKFSNNYEYVLFQNGYSKTNKRILIELLKIEINTIINHNHFKESNEKEIEIYAIFLGEQKQIVEEFIYQNYDPNQAENNR